MELAGQLSKKGAQCHLEITKVNLEGLPGSKETQETQDRDLWWSVGVAGLWEFGEWLAQSPICR